MIWNVVADAQCHTDDAQSAEATSLTGNHEITSWGGSEDGNAQVWRGGGSVLLCAIASTAVRGAVVCDPPEIS